MARSKNRPNQRYASSKYCKPLATGDNRPSGRRESCKSKPVRYGSVVSGKYVRNTDKAEENRPKAVKWQGKNYYVNPNIVG